MNKCEKKRIALKRMREIYYPHIKDFTKPYLDWMGYEIDKENTPSYHHIERAAKKLSEDNVDEFSIENGAYLGEYSHAALHIIEKYDFNLYSKWNELFKRIIREKQYPSQEIWAEVLILQEESSTLLENIEKKKSKNKKKKIKY